MEEVLLAVEQFMITGEQKKLEDVVPKRIKMLRILESRRPVVLRVSTIKNLAPEDAKFLDDYWYYLGVLN